MIGPPTPQPPPPSAPKDETDEEKGLRRLFDQLAGSVSLPVLALASAVSKLAQKRLPRCAFFFFACRTGPSPSGNCSSCSTASSAAVRPHVGLRPLAFRVSRTTARRARSLAWLAARGLANCPRVSISFGLRRRPGFGRAASRTGTSVAELCFRPQERRSSLTA